MSRHSHSQPNSVRLNSIQCRWLNCLLERPIIASDTPNLSPMPQIHRNLNPSRHKWFKSSFSCPIITSNSSNCHKLVRMSRIQHNSSTTRLDSIQTPLDSSLLIAIQLDVPQLVSRCQHMPLNHHELPKMRRTHSRSAHLLRPQP